MAWYHVGACDCPVGCCDCGAPVKADDTGTQRFAQLVSEGCQVSIKNDGHHWIIKKNGTRIDYWPSTERFRVNLKKGLDRGYPRVLRTLGLSK